MIAYENKQIIICLACKMKKKSTIKANLTVGKKIRILKKT